MHKYKYWTGPVCPAPVSSGISPNLKASGAPGSERQALRDPLQAQPPHTHPTTTTTFAWALQSIKVRRAESAQRRAEGGRNLRGKDSTPRTRNLLGDDDCLRPFVRNVTRSPFLGPRVFALVCSSPPLQYQVDKTLDSHHQQPPPQSLIKQTPPPFQRRIFIFDLRKALPSNLTDVDLNFPSWNRCVQYIISNIQSFLSFLRGLGVCPSSFHSTNTNIHHPTRNRKKAHLEDVVNNSEAT